MKKNTVLILGAEGMLGQELTRVYRADSFYAVVAWDYEDIDVSDFPQSEEKIRMLSPTLILNAVAYNAVDACEESEGEYQKALKLNSEVPGFLACLARDMGATLVHYSTDYVFDGSSEEGYTEDAVTHPLSKYGHSKREGEKQLLAAGELYYLIRLSKLFGKPAISPLGKKSFFEKMLELTQTKKEISVVDDEKSCFTYAPDLALATKVLVEEGKPFGIYHLVNSGAVTWYDAAVELFHQAGMNIVVRRVSANDLSRPAKRPHTSELRNTKFLSLRPYTEALEEFLREQRNCKKGVY